MFGVLGNGIASYPFPKPETSTGPLTLVQLINDQVPLVPSSKYPSVPTTPLLLHCLTLPTGQDHFFLVLQNDQSQCHVWPSVVTLKGCALGKREWLRKHLTFIFENLPTLSSSTKLQRTTLPCIVQDKSGLHPSSRIPK